MRSCSRAVGSALEDPEELRTLRRRDPAEASALLLQPDRRRSGPLRRDGGVRDGVEPPAPDPMMRALMRRRHDADVFRARLEMITCLALPQEVFARPGFVDKMNAVAAGKEPFQMPGPNHEELLQLLA